jgi:D-aminoacyl-tRNA deacylase
VTTPPPRVKCQDTVRPSTHPPEASPIRCIIQRVSAASVTVSAAPVASINAGLLVLVGFVASDSPAQVAWAADKLAHLRIFEDDQGRMNLSVLDTRGSILLVPNFTLAADARKGRRPSFDAAMKPDAAAPLFDALARALADLAVPTQTGVFRAHMAVSLCNDGPVTIILDSDA